MSSSTKSLRCPSFFTIIQDGERFPYVTRRQQGDHPPGTECVVSRPEGMKFLRLEFNNGDVIDHEGGYAAGIECTPVIMHLERLEAAQKKALEDSQANEDYHILGLFLAV